MKKNKFLVIGGGIAGVTCAEQLSSLCPTEEVALITASKLIKAVKNYQKVSRTLEQFDVEERPMIAMETDFPNVQVIHNKLTNLDTDKQVAMLADGGEIQYEMVCICTGARPRMIAANNPFVLGIRDTESVQTFQKRLHNARRIVVIGNGGIATELVWEVQGCEVLWAVKDRHISTTFVDPGAAQFFLPHLNKEKPDTSHEPIKRHKYAEQGEGDPVSADGGAALGPDWTADLQMRGITKTGHAVHVDYEVEVRSVMSPEEFRISGKPTTQPPGFSTEQGVVPNVQLFLQNNFTMSNEGGIQVNDQMETNVPGVFAAGDVCTASWDWAPHWHQMRLWSQARQMGAYAARCMAARDQGDQVHLDFCFEMFAHVTNFFNYKVILLGKFNGQGLGNDYEILLRVTKGVEYVKVVLHDNRMAGALLVGDTDLEETFENLILNQTDLSPFKDHLLDPDIDIDDFFD
ncbi:PYRD1-like protein [Mya arenaria]|uniref:Pyridine nucleotide-disulfide oxidoreductase domain-containing protein 1 n=1 Tax=Mya arenaria TaxID=6604 RepID=A0ABY7EDR7_MYAAR|nr:PYRD1-like protein [Mya arenaria]